MAWTTLINSLFLPGKKILGSTGMALRDNLIAVLTGDATAHAANMAIRAAAMRGVAAGSEVCKTILGTWTQSASAGRSVAGGPTAASLPLTLIALTALRAGTITVSAQMRRDVSTTGSAGSSTGFYSVDVLVNGVSALTLTTTSSSYATFTGNVTFAAGDVIEFRHTASVTQISSGTAQTEGFVRQLKCLSDIASFAFI